MNNVPPAKFTLHVIEGYIQNIFLLEYEHGLLLFDSGAVNDIKRIEDYCWQVLKRSPLEIKLVVVSHIHPDHSGGAALLRKNFGAAIAAHKDMDRWYSGLGGLIQQAMDCFMMQGVAWRTRGKIERALFSRKIKADFLLDDGDQLPGFADWKVIHVPGHTSHDLVLYNEKESLLYASDCVCDVKGTLRIPLPIMFPRQMQASYAKLAALNASSILLAHGQAVHTQIAPDFFLAVQSLLQTPPTKLRNRVMRMSIYSPEWWRQRILQRKESRKNGSADIANK